MKGFDRMELFWRVYMKGKVKYELNQRVTNKIEWKWIKLNLYELNLRRVVMKGHKMNEIEWNRMKPNETEWNRMKSNEIEWNRMKPNETRMKPK